MPLQQAALPGRHPGRPRKPLAGTLTPEPDRGSLGLAGGQRPGAVAMAAPADAVARRLPRLARREPSGCGPLDGAGCAWEPAGNEGNTP
jgi:hypothetical protein